MNRAWLINSRGLAKKVKNAGLPAAYQIKDCGANRHCPNCQYLIDNSDVSHEWPGLPAGVKFDPSDVELLEHLAAKNGVGDLEPHDFIDEFIPTIEGDEGICYTHPENLPGAKRDGSAVHFFYRITNAYASGQRKRRRIQGQENAREVHVRWHKTGKTKPVLQNGVHIGFKKIMVLYETSKRGFKPGKCNWAMHQYHLGNDVDEREGEFVVSKVLYQGDRNETCLVDEDHNPGTVHVVPRTPKTITPDRYRQEKTPLSECGSDDYAFPSIAKETEYLNELPHPFSGCKMETEYATSLAENCKADSLLCNEKIDSYAAFADLPLPHNNMTDLNHREHDANAYCGISDLDNLELDTPPDFQLSDLQFPSQDSVFDFLDRL